MDKYRLIPTIDTAQYGRNHYLFDRAADAKNVIFVPTQKITPDLFLVVRALKKRWPDSEPYSVEECMALFETDKDKKCVEMLLKAGYLEQKPEDTSQAPLAQEPGVLSGEAKPAVVSNENGGQSFFKNNVFKHYLKKPSFFNLPAQIDNEDAHIGFVGVPVSSIPMSTGTRFAPDRIRYGSQFAGFWFDIYSQGLYSEIGCDDSTPRLLGRDAVVKDFGDLGVNPRTVGQFFQETSDFVAKELVPNKIRPIFVGGDHAITFPLVSAYLEHFPKLTLIHLDAHNDLYYGETIEFSHACPVRGLLVESGLESLYSFGLRTHGDPRVKPFTSFEEQTRNGKKISDNVHLHSIGATQRLLQNPEKLIQKLVSEIGPNAPVYLTIDLDVLSGSAMGGQLSTPAGHGLEFHQLFDFVDIVSDNLNLIASDVVELNIKGDLDNNQPVKDITVLMVQLADGMYRSQKRQEAYERSCHRDINKLAARLSSKLAQPPNNKANGILNSVNCQVLKEFKQIPRISVNKLNYRDFISDFVVPSIPLVITDVKDNGAFRHWDLDYFADRVNAEQVIDTNVFEIPFDHSTVHSEQFNLFATLKSMRENQRTGESVNSHRNIVNWNFSDSIPDLFDDIPLLDCFDMDVSHLVHQRDHVLKWVYIGEPGTGTKTHTDILNTSAWLFLAHGQKKWRMVHGDQTKQCSVDNKLIDLFDPVSVNEANLNLDRSWETIQNPGEIVWTPPLCVHAVRNVDYCIAITQNYADLTNLSSVISALLIASKQKSLTAQHNKIVKNMIESSIESMEAKGFSDLVEPFLEDIKTVVLEQKQRFNTSVLEVFNRP